jgi:hypothetical protein
MKGGKHHTKAQGSNPADCLRRCLVNFQRQFSGLNWEYMCCPDNGTLLIDLGVTHHPSHSVPVVGLWRLDSLEASFGAAGFRSGSIHHLNTLSLYGGLQAEMSVKHMERSHVVFRSAYNLAYEVTRPLDNNRDLFHEKDAYALDPEYLDYIHKISDIYTKDASHKSFGVRDEIRIGGEAFLRVVNDLDFQVIPFISSCHTVLRSSKGRRDYAFQSHPLDPITNLVQFPIQENAKHLSGPT